MRARGKRNGEEGLWKWNGRPDSEHRSGGSGEDRRNRASGMAAHLMRDERFRGLRSEGEPRLAMWRIRATVDRKRGTPRKMGVSDSAGALLRAEDLANPHFSRSWDPRLRCLLARILRNG